MSNSITLKFTRDELFILVHVLQRDVARDQGSTGNECVDFSCPYETKLVYARACMLEDLSDRLKEFPR